MAQTDFERLYDDHAQAVFAFLLNLTRHEADTRDLLQELFVKLAKQPEVLDGVRDERAFLLRLAHNLAVNLFRRRGTREKNYEQLAGETLGCVAPRGAPGGGLFPEGFAPRVGETPGDQPRVVSPKVWEGATVGEN